MTELAKSSTELSDKSAAVYAASLLRYYSFELGDNTIDQLLTHWLSNYPVNWVRLAAIEALYQGRYKAISVEQILAFWQRRGSPLYHFNHEFERLVCEKFPRNLVPASPSAQKPVPDAASLLQPGLPYRSAVLQLPSLKATSKLREPIALPVSAEESVKPSPATSEPNSQPATQTYSYDLRALRESQHSSVAEPHHSATGELDTTSDQQTVKDTLPESNLTDGSGDSNLAPATSQDDTLQNSAQVLRSLEPIERNIQDMDWFTMNQLAAAATLNHQADYHMTSRADQLTEPAATPDPTPNSGESCAAAPEVKPLLDAKTVFVNLGLMDRSLKPKLKLQLATLDQPNSLLDSLGKHPIHQFTPASEASEFHSKLRAVAQPPEVCLNDD